MIIDNGLEELKKHISDIIIPLFPSDAFVFLYIENYREIIISVWFHNKPLKPMIIRVTEKAVLAYIRSNISLKKHSDNNFIQYISNLYYSFHNDNKNHVIGDENEIVINNLNFKKIEVMHKRNI